MTTQENESPETLNTVEIQNTDSHDNPLYTKEFRTETDRKS